MGNFSFISYKLGNQSSASYGLSMGLLYMVLHYCGKNISGGVYSPVFMLALLMNKSVKLSMFGTYVAGYVLASYLASMMVHYSLPGAVSSKLESLGAMNGIPNFDSDIQGPKLIMTLFIFTTVQSLLYLYVTVDRDVDSDPSGAVLGGTVAAFTCASAHGLSGVYNPVRVIGGLFVVEMDPSQISLIIIPVLGGLLGFVLYRYVLAGEDLSVIFAEDEAEV
jgi:glycerol uptake facilitator-like aquaporin